MNTFVNQAPSHYYRSPQIQNLHAIPSVEEVPRTDIRDDYERWYTETVPNNRMSLSLRSGIHSELDWSLTRLCRLCLNEKFSFSSLPGLIDGLFDWPDWYVREGYKQYSDIQTMFSPSPELARQHRYAVESVFILRNSVLLQQNATDLLQHTHTAPLLLDALHNLDFTRDENTEFLIHIIEILHVLAPYLNLAVEAPPNLSPFQPLVRIASQSSNRSLIITSLAALAHILSSPANFVHLSACIPALDTSTRYLPLFSDHGLLEACLNYLYVHVSYLPMARAFLHRPEMPTVLRVLVSLILYEQQGRQEKITLDITGPVHTVPSTAMAQRDHELSKEELDGLLGKPEPMRCYDWMKIMFVPKVDGELTQVDFWNLYKDAFSPHQETYPLLVASDVIKNVSTVFPQAQAMVLQGPTRFVVRGVDRRKVLSAQERFKCQWDRSQCPTSAFLSPADLYEHVLEHLVESEGSELQCLWSSCQHSALPKPALRTHILTHLSSSQPPQKHPSQSDTITLPSADSPYPTDSPTTRPVPPPRSTVITYEQPYADPPSSSLTALLIIRILYRTSFASAEAAPRVDADHFGFPGIVEDTSDQDGPDVWETVGSGDDREGESRGRKAFVGIRQLLEGVRLRDEILMSWVTEMVDAGISGVP